LAKPCQAVGTVFQSSDAFTVFFTFANSITVFISIKRFFFRMCILGTRSPVAVAFAQHCGGGGISSATPSA
jgi:hypothetical protein